ncbi:DUF2334 domain-containing protein [Clostridium sp.]|uniref:DUF2334 domain-containing protein n=1 Tax=Clostridium sp. TaxID=1506 RepID=UPI003D6D37F2
MMFKKVALFTIISCMVFQLAQIKVFASTVQKSKVLIVYDRKTEFGYSHDFVSTLEELMGAFDTDVDTVNIIDYTSSTLNKYDYVFIYTIDKGLNNQTFINDVEKYKNKLCIIGKGMDDILKNTKKYDLVYLGDKTNCNQVFYSNNRESTLTYDKMDKFYLQANGTFPTVKTTGSAASVLSYVSDGLNYYPLVINQGNLWYMSVVDDNFILLYIFSDILNDIFQRSNIPKSQVFIRIEDVNPFADISKLKAVANYLYSEQIPFIIALIPTYVNPQTSYITTLSEKSDFVNTILYMQNRGGSVILHGYTHQHYTGVTTGEGFEFWDHVKDSPLNLDVNKYIDDRIGSGISSCVENGIYPLGFEAPHYAMGSKGYLAIKKYFSTYVGEFQSSDASFTLSKFPYKLYNTKYFNKLVPENLGYIDPTNPMTLVEMEESFRQISIVRGYTAGLFFHPYLDISYLKSIVSYLKSKDVCFFDLKMEENWVKFGNIKITSKNGSINVQGEAQSTEKPTTKLNYISSINTFVIVLVSIFCIIFIILIVMSRKIYKNKYYR